MAVPPRPVAPAGLGAVGTPRIGRGEDTMETTMTRKIRRPNSPATPIAEKAETETARTTRRRRTKKQVGSALLERPNPTRRAGDRGKRDAGRAGAVTTAGARPTKQAAILNLLRRAKGASIGDLTSAIGWQAHSVRAALTGLRKRGHDIERSVESGASRYRIIEKRKAARS
jgi:hypothetical protein